MMKTKTSKKPRIFKCVLFVAYTCLLLLFSGSLYAVYEIRDKLSGPAFIDYSRILEMPEEWERRPVTHEPSIGDVDLAINLDQQMYRLFADTLKQYAKKNGLKIGIIDSTCGNSSGMLRRKMIDIGGFCCAPGAMDRLPGLKFHTTGIAPVSLFVHPENPINNITLEQARRIFMGEIYRWSELKMPDGRPGNEVMVNTIGRLHCKTRPGHWRLLLDNENLFSPRLIEVGNIPDMVSQVAANPNAIGHETVWLATEYYKNKGMVKPLKINGYAPEDLEALLAGRYKIYKTFNVTTWESKEAKNADALKLVDYLIKQVEVLDESYGIIASSRLRKAGWRFSGNELIGEPEQ